MYFKLSEDLSSGNIHSMLVALLQIKENLLVSAHVRLNVSASGLRTKTRATHCY